jgi:hypothetical protein
MGARVLVSGEYEILERLGAGGMGEVFKARHHGTGGFERFVVIKRILPYLGGDERMIQMFLSEARLLSRLVHPNIVQVLTLGRDDEGYFIATEYVAGQTLATVVGELEEHELLPPVGLGALVARDLCRALDYAWELRGDDGQPLHLVHRDVSPSNVMVGLSGEVKLLDFGVAKMLSEAQSALNPATETGVLKGKLGYMAPERLRDEPFDQRADLYSVAVLLHEALTGFRLFDNGSPNPIEIEELMRRPIEPPSQINHEVPPALDEICLRALSYDPESRFASGYEMAAALEAVLFDLKWGASELAALMQGLFPPRAIDNDLAFAETVARRQSVAERYGRVIAPYPSLANDSAEQQTSARDTIKVDASTTGVVAHDTDVVELYPAGGADDVAALATTPGRRLATNTGDGTMAPRVASASGELCVIEADEPPPEEWGETSILSRNQATASPPIFAAVETVPFVVPPETSTRETRPRRGRGLLALVAILGAGAAGLWLGRYAETWLPPAPPRPAIVTTPITAQATTPSQAGTPPEQIIIRVESEPSGATVLLSGTPEIRDRTPFAARVPRSTTPRALTVSLPGFETVRVSVHPHAPVEAHVLLRPSRN